MEKDSISCVVVDDEPPALAVIEKYIAAIPTLRLVASCGDAVEALSALQNTRVDLLLLDIHLPNIFGTDFMRTLRNPPKVIFTTAFRKYALEGFELDAVDYLLKPISFERFLKAVNKVMQSHISVSSQFPGVPQPASEQYDAFYIRADRKNLRIPFNDILFVEGLKDYIKIVMKDKTVVTKQSITSLEETLPSAMFIRIHRSFIVQVSKIDSFTRELIHVNKYELPVSRTYRNEVEKLLKKPG
ncbi:MAG: LytTR family DNA-binding domain-containing protein [Bacteroidota bacterium]